MISRSLNHKCCVLKPSICDLHINEKWVNSEPISLANSKEIIQENLCKYTKKSFSIFSFKEKKTSHPKTCVESVLLIKFDSSQMLGVETEYY